jgi:hypothetical protein
MENETRVSMNKRVTRELREYIDKLTMDLRNGPKGLDGRVALRDEDGTVQGSDLRTA